ncbi:hypothetical protein BJY54_001957 [Streptomyces nodosus]|uniref:Uncharacterized protein n=1 Tax=Streptomyces nodosus TaxID=40318 RepID=A0A5P2W4Y3_9ACTN|nr:hypothetical protein [Streptomyces nodosus]MBB4791345.1 hypothetical protein [Streptomyces nodosus]QEV38893.1 hypothetical protein CP978_10260 [Streptomyces nodosus]
MAEHDSGREDREPEEKGVPLDEEAVWAAIVAGYGAEPPDPPGARPFRSVEDLALPEMETDGGAEETKAEKGKAKKEQAEEEKAGSGSAEQGGAQDDAAEPAEPAGPLGSSVSFAPGVGGPRDYSLRQPSDDDFDEGDEGHFVPPEPPPLPDADTTAKFAWLAVIGGPLLLLLAVLLGWEMTWWLALIGIGGFLGGFLTLVVRMNTDEEDDDPGRGAVV